MTKKFIDLRAFLDYLEQQQQLKKINVTVSPCLQMTEISDRVLRQQGPALLFTQPTNYSIPVLTNLFGTPERVALGMGQPNTSALRQVGEILAALKSPEPPKDWRQAIKNLPALRRVLDMRPKHVRTPIAQTCVIEKADVDLSTLPIQTCWPGDVAPLITWGLTITKGPHRARQNIGIYRQQVIGRNRVIMRWLAHRGGAIDYLEWQKQFPQMPFPVVVALGADPATILAAVTPIPDTLSEFAFAGLLREARTPVASSSLHASLSIPATAEIILEGYIYPNDTAPEGPYGDHTGYYNEVERFPVLTIERITHRPNPIYHSTYTGRPPDEPAMLGVALNEVFIPILQKQYPEIIDFYLPPEGCSYRLAVISIKKRYAGHAKRVMMGVWSFLRQFMYTKYLIIVDDDINVRDWQDVIWAMTTRMDPIRDTTMIDHTPIDYLDFASPISGLGSKMGLDATNKWPGETQREWGSPIAMRTDIKEQVDAMWSTLGL